LPDHKYIPLSVAAEQAYRELAGVPPAMPVDPAFLRAAALALSAFLPIGADGLVERAQLRAALATLRHAGVSFSEVRPQSAPRRLPRVHPA
jgi:hypothetical protein